MKILAALFLVALAGAAVLKGSTHYVALGFNWLGPVPRMSVSHGRGWVVSYRSDLTALRELVTTMTRELEDMEIRDAVK